MNKSELAMSLSEKFPGLRIEDVQFAVNNILEQMSETLSSGKRIEVRGFGSFELRYRTPRISRNPITGEKFMLSDRYYPHFNPGKELRKRVNKKGM